MDPLVGVTVGLLVALLLPPCGDSCGDDGPGVDHLFATAERWVRVQSVPDHADVDGTVTMDIEATPIDEGNREGSPRIERIAVHSSFLPGIVDGKNREGDVFLAFSSKGLEREMVSYVLVRESTGSHHLAGDCTAEGEALLRERLGSAYDPGWLV